MNVNYSPTKIALGMVGVNIIKKKVFCENEACQDGEVKGREFSSRTCGECDAFCECSLGGSNAAVADDVACQYFDDTSLSQMKSTKL